MKTHNKSILIVDDQFINFYLIKELLANYKINVIYASCGIEAYEQCLKNENIALVFMDIKMKGINGFETAIHIKNIRKNLPIVFQTSYAKEFLKDELMNKIGNGFLEKPIKKETLLNEIKKHTNIEFNNYVDNNINQKKRKGFFHNILNQLAATFY
ncbi:MAG: response regulator [Bacteroidia bacterium]|nr:response regulator [Bacteroidia bacterium]